MLAWEFEHPGGAGAVHHLTVLCYNLQHPSAYSREALITGRALLAQFVKDGASPQQIRTLYRQMFDSGRRTFSFTGTAETHGVYVKPVNWTTTVADVHAGGLDGYCERVEAWACSVYAALVDSGNYSPI
jgi:hypothetical protein